MSIETFCDVLALLRKAPRTVVELVKVTGLRRATVQAYVDALHAEGHVRKGVRPIGGTRTSVEFGWQDTLHGEPDAEVREIAKSHACST